MSSSTLLSIFITALASILASSGFWTWMQKRGEGKSATSRLLMGLAYDKITHLGMEYIAKGWITHDELEDYRKYLFEPYRELGGNGTAERIMSEVEKLPLKSYTMQINIPRVENNRGSNA